MEYVISPASCGYPPWAYYDDAFNEDELDTLEALAMSASGQGAIGRGESDGERTREVRRSLVHWEGYSKESAWIYERLEHVVQQLNAQFYRFQLIGFTESLQFSHYLATNRGKYRWHQDFGQGQVRKLSLVMQLTSPEKYEGGDLQIDTALIDENSEPYVYTVEKKRGRIVVFPSWTIHQVTPVDSGSRCSIVAWLGGEPFK